MHEEPRAAQGIMALGTQTHYIGTMGTRGLWGYAFKFPNMVPASGYGTHVVHGFHSRVIPTLPVAGISLPDKECPSILDVLFRFEEADGDG